MVRAWAMSSVVRFSSQTQLPRTRWRKRCSPRCAIVCRSVRALLKTEAIAILRLEEELARTAPDAPLLRHPVPVLDLIARLPPHLCAALVAVPVRADALTGTVNVAVADASDTHAAEEIGFYLSAPVRLLRSPLGAIESAIDQARLAREAVGSSIPPSIGPISVPPPSPVRPMSHTPPWGSPAFVRPPEPEEASATGSELPMPLIPKTASKRVPDAAAEPSDAPPGPDGDVAVPLLRRLTPGAGLLALARAAQELDDEEDPVVELRRPKSSKPPEVVPFELLPRGGETAGAAPMAEEEPKLISLPAPAIENRRHAWFRRRGPNHHAALDAAEPAPPRNDESDGARSADGARPHRRPPDGPQERALRGEEGRLRRLDVHVRFRRPAPPRAGSDRRAQTEPLSTTAAAGTYMGPLPRNETHAPLARFIKAQEPEILGVAIKAAGRPAVLLIAHEVGEPLKAMTILTEVARIAGETLERILRSKR